jgi:Spy/CpxP family protein refolding chaperone
VVLVVTVMSPGFRAAPRQAGGTTPKATVPAQQGQGGRAEGPSQQRNQPRRGFAWWKEAEVMREVGITAEQSKRIDELFHKRLPEAIALEREFKKQNDELNRLLRERTVGADVIAVQVDRVEAQRTTLNKTRTVMIYQMYQVLSAEQYAKLVAYNERRRSGRGGSNR